MTLATAASTDGPSANDGRVACSDEAGQAPGVPDTTASRLRGRIEHLKVQVRARGEHAFRVIKRQFGYVKVRYCGLTKGTRRSRTCCLPWPRCAGGCPLQDSWAPRTA